MAKVTIKGNEFEAITIRDSFNRRAIQFQNNIIASLRKIGLTIDDIDIQLEPNGIKRAPAFVSWYFDKYHLYYSYSLMPRYVENLYVVSKVIDLAVTALIEEKMSVEEFVSEFAEEIDVAKKRKQARTVLGLEENTTDLKVIDKAYKDLAKKHHPDTENGNTEKFKEINNAHKVIKRELS